MDNTLVYKANGKILLTGEYLVIDGASALAVPLKFGQTLKVEQSTDNLVYWRAIDVNGVWFEATISLPEFKIEMTSDESVANKAIMLLKAASTQNPEIIANNGYHLTFTLNYDRLFGFGSSSTLISLLAQFFKIDPFRFYSMVAKGSGYDIACAQFNSPFLYTRSGNKATIKPLNDFLPFGQNIYLVYQGHKQDTDSEIDNYQKVKSDAYKQMVESISNITFKIVKTKDLYTFAELLKQHELLIATLLNRQTIKDLRFSDFNGVIKSLGAWGGDFILAISSNPEEYIHEYFKDKQHNIVYNYNDIILTPSVVEHDTIISY